MWSRGAYRREVNVVKQCAVFQEESVGKMGEGDRRLHKLSSIRANIRDRRRIVQRACTLRDCQTVECS